MIAEKLLTVDWHVPYFEAPVRVPSASKTALVIAGAALTLGIFQIWWTWYQLRHIPGPFLASVTNFQRVHWVRTKRAHLILQQQHEKYGELVRIGPKTVSFSDAEAIPTVYPMRTGFPKVGMLQKQSASHD